MILISRWCLFALMTCLVGCSSPEIRYHTLIAPTAETQNSAPPAPFLIELLPVGVPAQLDQPQLVVRQGESGALILENERWLSPLGDEFRSALSAGLVSRLNTQDVSGLAQSTAKPVVRIAVQIRRFDAWPDQFVRLESDWSLSVRHGESRSRLVCSSRLTEQAAQGYSGMIEAQQQVIARLSDHIADTVRQWADGGAGECVR